MAFPFGVYIGDFIAGINFIIDCVKAVDDIKDASASYQQLVSALGAIIVALKTVVASNLQAVCADFAAEREQGRRQFVPSLHEQLSSTYRQV